MAYEKEVALVDAAIQAIRNEKPVLIAKLSSEQMKSATGLEYYGITKSVFEEFIAKEKFTKETKEALIVGIDAVKRIFSA